MEKEKRAAPDAHAVAERDGQRVADSRRYLMSRSEQKEARRLQRETGEVVRLRDEIDSLRKENERLAKTDEGQCYCGGTLHKGVICGECGLACTDGGEVSHLMTMAGGLQLNIEVSKVHPEDGDLIIVTMDGMDACELQRLMRDFKPPRGAKCSYIFKNDKCQIEHLKRPELERIKATVDRLLANPAPLT